jgi:hypothetical protein
MPRQVRVFFGDRPLLLQKLQRIVKQVSAAVTFAIVINGMAKTALPDLTIFHIVLML